MKVGFGMYIAYERTRMSEKDIFLTTLNLIVQKVIKNERAFTEMLNNFVVINGFEESRVISIDMLTILAVNHGCDININTKEHNVYIECPNGNQEEFSIIVNRLLWPIL